MLPGETRSFYFTATAVAGSAPFTAGSFAISGLPAGTTVTFTPTSGPVSDGAPFQGTASITVPSSAPLGQTQATLSATASGATRTLGFTFEVRTPLTLINPEGIALESGGATALVVETVGASRLVRVSVATKAALQTIAQLPHNQYWPRSVAIEAGGATALVNADDSLLRINLGTGLATTITTSLFQPLAIAIEPGGATALVSDCGTANDCNNDGRIVRVTLASGSVTQVSAALTALDQPYGIALDNADQHLLIAEASGLTRLSLSTQSLSVINGALPGEPLAVVPESDGVHALVAYTGNGPSGGLVRVNLSGGMMSWVAAFGGGSWSGIALNGGEALVTLAAQPGYVRSVALDTPLEILAPSSSSTVQVNTPFGVAIEDGGATALVTDSIAGNENGASGQLLRVELATGNTTLVTSSLRSPNGMALEPGGQRALVVEDPGFSSDLAEVSLADGGVRIIQAGVTSPTDVALLDGGASVVEGGFGFNSPFLATVNLADGGYQGLQGFSCCAAPEQLAVEDGGASFLYALNGTNLGTGSTGALFRYTFGSGSTTLISGLDTAMGLAIEDGGQTAIVTEADSAQDGRVFRADLVHGKMTVLDTGRYIQTNENPAPPQYLAIEDGGQSALVALTGHLARVQLAPADAQLQRLAGPLPTPGGIALEASGATALITTCGSGDQSGGIDCTTNGTLSRVALDFSGATTALVTGLNAPRAVALLNSTTALVTDCGPTNASGGCAGNGRILEVNLSNNSDTVLTPNLDDPRCLFVEAAGTALVCEYGAGRLLRVDPSDGSFVALASGLQGPVQAWVEPEGTSALVAVSGSINRVVLATGATTLLAPGPSAAAGIAVRFAPEPGNATLLAAPAGNGFNAGLWRVNRATGGVDVLAPSLFDGPSAIVPGPGSTYLVSESRYTTGGLFSLTLP